MTPQQRFIQTVKARLEMTALEAETVFDALHSYEPADPAKAAAVTRVFGRLGIELARIGRAKIR